MTRDEVLTRLSTLMRSQFEEVIFRAKIPPQYLPDSSQTERAIAAVHYIEPQNRLSDLIRILEELAASHAPGDGTPRSSDRAARLAPGTDAASPMRESGSQTHTLLESIPTYLDDLASDQLTNLSKERKSRHFRSQVSAIFKMMHYETTIDREFTGRRASIFLTGTFGDLIVHRVIHLAPSGVTQVDIDTLSSTLRHARRDYPMASGTIITETSDLPCEHNIELQAQIQGISILSLENLDAQLFDGRGYVRQIADILRSDSRYRPDVYIEATVSLDGSDACLPALEMVKDWLTDPTWNQCTLLGDVGTGKTFLTHILFLQLAEAHLNAPTRNPLPILIDLRNADRQFSLEGLITTHLHQKGLERITFSLFQHALAEGRIVLLLDGFDEMAARVTPQITARNFHELIRCVKGKAKVFLTCRTHYFKDRSDEEVTIYGGAREYSTEAARELYWDLVARRGFKIAYLRPFERDQIERYIRRTRPLDAGLVIAKIGEIYDLMELSQRPMLLEMIVSSIDRLNSDSVNAATLYQVFTDIWIQRDRWREGITSPESKHQLVTSLALRLWMSGEDHVHYRDLAAHVSDKLGPMTDPQAILEADSELRIASFLVRNSVGEYRFAHKSYAEFFVAGHIARSLDAGKVDCLDAKRRLGKEHLSFFVDLINSPDRIDNKLQAVLQGPYINNISENALLCLYSLRRSKLNKQGRPDDMVELPVRMILESADLEGTYLANSKMREARMSETRLYAADFRKCDLVDTDLSRADCRKAIFERARLTWSVCIKTDFRGANLTNANLSGADTTGALLDDAIVVGTRHDRQDAESMLLRRWLPLVENIVQGRSSEERHDIIQHIMLDILVMARATGASGLQKVGRREVLAIASKRTRQYSRNLYRERRHMLPMEDAIDIELLGSSEDQYTKLEEAETGQTIREVISELPENHQKIIQFWLDGLSISEIAEKLDMSQSTVSAIRSRTLAALRNEHRIFTLGM